MAHFDSTVIMYYQLSQCLRSFLKGNSYRPDLSYRENIKQYIFRHCKCYGTAQSYLSLVEQFFPKHNPTVTDTNTILQQLQKVLDEEQNKKSIAG